MSNFFPVHQKPLDNDNRMTHECFTEGCSAQLADEPGNYYCDACVERQLKAQSDEQAAFNAYHQFADACLR